MGQRTVKRVRMNFDWPFKKIWKGYINPYPGPVECTVCEGTGYNPETKKIANAFYDFEGTGERWCDKITQDEVQALVDEGRLMHFTHDLISEKGWVKKDPPYIPTAEEVNERERKAGPFCHDAINRHILIEARAKRFGVWGLCSVCKGEGEIPQPDAELRKKYEEWKEYEPPKGKGWQLWETTSEGSPISPVFGSTEELAEWCEENATVFADHKTTKENWLKMFISEKDITDGSTVVGGPGFFGPLINVPKNKPN